MTSPLPPLTDDDLSALLDGEAGPDVVRRVQADPAARARLEQLRSARDALRGAAIEAPDAATLDRLIGRAVEEVVTSGGRTASEPAATDDRVVPLPASRRPSSRNPRWLVAAAIVALVGIGLALVWSGSRTDRSDLATRLGPGDRTTQGPEAERSLTDGAGRGEATGDLRSPTAPTPGSPDTTTAPTGRPPVTELGTFASLDALRVSLRDRFPSDRPSVTQSPAVTTAALDRCAGLMEQVFALPSKPTHVGRATIGADAVFVFQFDAPSARDGSPTTFVTVNEPASCAARLSFERTAR